MTEPIGLGAFVAVVGASGVGKDALLAYAREHADALVRFPRRAITRPPGPGEDHEPMTEDQFTKALDQGAFAMYWQAHGLRYGIPAWVDAEVRDGLVVVANVSRSVIDELDARYRRLVVVSVTVSEEVRAQRLRGRRRESEPGIGQRLARPDPAPGHRVDAVIHCGWHRKSYWQSILACLQSGTPVMVRSDSTARSRRATSWSERSTSARASVAWYCLNPPRAFTDCGVRPMCPITGISAERMASMVVKTFSA